MAILNANTLYNSLLFLMMLYCKTTQNILHDIRVVKIKNYKYVAVSSSIHYVRRQSGSRTITVNKQARI
jgi:hypothetical protein